ncbi:MAG: hypothetical protein RSB59_04260, partial [Clostridia bacterium]
KNLDGKYVLATLAEKNDITITKYSAVEDEKGTIVKVVNKDKTFYFKAEANLTTDEKILVETNRLSNVIIKCSDKHLSLIITESFIVGLIGMLVGNADVQNIFDTLPELGLDLTVDLNFEKLALEVTLNSNIIRLYLGIIEPRVATEMDERISNRISDELIFKLLSDKEKATYALGKFSYENDKKVFVEDKNGVYKNLEYVLMTEAEKTAWEALATKTPIYIYNGDVNGNKEYDKGDYQFVAITALADAGTGTDAKSVYKKLGDGETKDYIKMADVMTEAEIAAYKGARYTKNGDRFEVSVNGEYMEREKYRFNKFERTGKVSFDLYLSLGLNISATYILLDDNTIKGYPESERYSKRVTDGKYIQDNNGNYVRQSLNLDEILGALLNLDSIKNSVANIMLGKVSLADILARLSLQSYFHDPISDGIEIHLFGNINLNKLGVFDLIDGNVAIADMNFTIDNLLASIEAGVEIIFNGGTVDETILGIYLVDGILYVDLGGFKGPKVKISVSDLMELANTANGDAMTAAGATAPPTEPKKDTVAIITNILNALVKTVVLRTQPINEVHTFKSLEILFNSTAIIELIKLVFPGENFDLGDLLLDEKTSGIFLTKGNTQKEMLQLQARINTLNGFGFCLTLGAGLQLTIDDQNTASILTENYKKGFVDIGKYIDNIMDLVSGFVNDRFVTANTEPVYYMFSENINGNYQNIGTATAPIYQLIRANEALPGNRFVKTNVRYMNGGMYREVYIQNNLGAYVLDDKTGDYRLITKKELEDIAANKKGCIAAIDRFELKFNDTAIGGDISGLQLFKATAGLISSGTKYEKLSSNIGDGSEIGKIEKYTYYAFDKDANGLYVKKSGGYRRINGGEVIEATVQKYSRTVVTKVKGVNQYYTYQQDDNGTHKYDLSKDEYVLIGAETVPANLRFAKSVAQTMPYGTALYRLQPATGYEGQYVSLSVSGLIYFNSKDTENYNLGSLVGNWLGDMLLQLKTESVFNDAVGFRLSANIDIAGLNFASIIDKSGAHGSFFNSDFTKMEIALELLRVNSNGKLTDENGNVNAIAGLY